MQQSDTYLWLSRKEPRPNARLRLFCFPYAGGGASAYRLWAAGLPDVDVCAIQLPGRENRLREQPLSSVRAQIDALLPILLAQLDRPYALFGHSMGGLLAMEMAHALLEAGAPRPQWLIVSARRPPQVPDPIAPLRHLPDSVFAAEINRRYGGIPAEILADQELMALLLPAMRADITALETYTPQSRAPLPCDVFSLGGTEDPTVSGEQLAAWEQVTTGRFVQRMFPGNHFYLTARRVEILAELRAILASSVADGARGDRAEIGATA